MRLPQRALSHADGTDVRPLLPLPLVPARVRSSYALNALVEADRIVHLGAEPELVATPSESGRGQTVARCPKCRIAIWSNYAGAGPYIRFVRVGTLDAPDTLSPAVKLLTPSR